MTDRSWAAAGRPADDVLAELAARRGADLPVHGGRTTAYVYDAGLPGLDELAARAHAVLASVNGLDPTAFPSVATVENDLVAAARDLLGGDGRTAGTVTSGGTESILLAVLGARELHRERHGSRGRPEVVLPTTAHPAFAKAAHVLDLDLRRVPVDPVTCVPSPAELAAAIGPGTALVVASAPSYAHGVLDPVAEVAGAAATAGVPCHVDACIGGWVLPFLDEPVAPWDLSVTGVTSLSVDLHKYGYAPKGVSVLLHRDEDLRRRGWFAWARWPGYPVVNPTLAGSRSAGPAAAAWAVLQHVGRDGFAALARAARGATLRVVEAVSATPGLRVVGTPASTLVAVADDGGAGDPDVRVVADELAARGWFVQPQPAYGSLPPTIHLTLTAAVVPAVDELLAALAEAVPAAIATGRAEPDPGLLALLGGLDPAAPAPGLVDQALAAAGLAGSTLPARMAPVHALLSALPPALAERLLAEVLGRVYRP